ncbi:MAG: NAD(P)/FAD-dependent oxidoreductase [Phycisphaerae bacterium]|nr:NAD(P)/FAD-dependent oxidoreductase [Phycisphaerae bacterium]
MQPARNKTTDAYDVVIVGAGVCGAAIARCLSGYDIRVAVVEKCADVSFGVSKANSGIVHAGFHHPADMLKTKLEIRGNMMFEKLQHELKFPFERIGILVLAFSPEEMEVCRRLCAQGRANGVPRLELLSAEAVRGMEPVLSPDVEGALYAPTGGIVEPYRYVFALMEAAQGNGATLLLHWELDRAERNGDVWELRARDSRRVRARWVVNAAGLFADEVSRILAAEEFRIVPRKGEEYLLQRGAAGYPNHVLFPVPSRHTKGMLVIPTVEGTMMVGPTAREIEDRHDVSTTAENLRRVFDGAKRMVPAISTRDIITAFAGLRPTLEDQDFYIDLSRRAPNVVQVAGIQSPGLTASPAIALYVKDLLKAGGLTLTEKADTRTDLPETTAVRRLSPEQVDEHIRRNPAYGNIVCRCENVSEAEVVEAIRKGHTTLDGIKFYTRAGMGRCQGGFCTYKILQILQRETNQPIETFTKRGKGSELILGRLDT